MWIFGIAASFINDPLYAGRLISVLISLVSAIGLYKVALNYVSKTFAVITAVLFIILPICFFYNRQALMESSMLCVGVWIYYYLEKMLKSSRYNEAMLLGLVVGVGYFIKSTVLLFFVTALVISLYRRLVEKDVGLWLRQSFSSLGVAILFDTLLLIQPNFWRTLGSNNRYVLTFAEVVTQSPAVWSSRLTELGSILIFGLTPLVLIAAIVGLSVLLKKKRDELIVWYFLITFMSQFIFERFVTSRYTMPFLGLVPLFAIIGFCYITNKRSLVIKTIMGLALLIIPFVFISYQIISPRDYLDKMAFSDTRVYLFGQNSGYGINEAVNFLREKIGDRKATIGVGLQTGNPESSVIMNFQKNQNIHAEYFDAKALGDVMQFDCLVSDTPVYFVSRNEEQVGLNKFLMNIKTIKQQGSDYTIGIYSLKSPCHGKSTRIFEQRT